jgi:hypothetical protein
VRLATAARNSSRYTARAYGGLREARVRFL